MANEYATLAALKLRVKIDVGDTADDVELQQKLTVASRDVDRDTGRRFWLDPAPVARTFAPRGRIVPTCDGEKWLIDDIGDTTSMVVELGSSAAGSSWSAVTGYETGPDNAVADGVAVEWLLRPMLPWATWPGQRIRITARWGWPTIPPAIVEATLIRAQRLFRRKDSPEGVISNPDFGGVRVSRWDPDYEREIADYVKPGIG